MARPMDARRGSRLRERTTYGRVGQEADESDSDCSYSSSSGRDDDDQEQAGSSPAAAPTRAIQDAAILLGEGTNLKTYFSPLSVGRGRL
eukprot:6931001-Pyramimonas_sp.AAC.1